MSLYDINFQIFWERVSPPYLRQSKMLAWGKSLMAPLQWIRDRFFGDYANGSTAPLWSNVATYVFGDTVRGNDRSVYVAIQAVPAATPLTDSAYWYKLQDIYIGAYERLQYNSQQLMLEYVLNKWYSTTFRDPTSYVAAPTYYSPKSDIFITKNTVVTNIFVMRSDSTSSKMKINGKQSDYIYSTATPSNYLAFNFTINVPLATFTTLGASNIERENNVRQIANKYVISGIKYNITTY